jgi:hypothetical protein
MPVIQNDWLTIKGKFGDRTALYALTTAQASLLLSIAPQLEWRKTYRAFGYDFADWDYLQEEVADLQRGLMMPVYIDDLIGKLDELTDAVFSLYCCPDGTIVDLTDGDQYVDRYTEDEPNGVPDNIVSSGYADDDDDWEGFYDYKCMISHIAIESLAQKLDKFEELADSATIGLLSTGAILVVLGTVIGVLSGGTFVIVLVILGGLAAIAEMYQELSEAAEGFFVDAADEVRANAQELACALFAGDGPTESYDLMISKADAILTAPVAAVVQLMNMKADLKALYSGRYNETDVAARLAEIGYETVGYDCSGCDEEPPPTGYHLAYPLEQEGWDLGDDCSNNGSSYDPDTGILILSYTNNSGNSTKFGAEFGISPNQFAEHGWKITYLSASIPGSQKNFSPSNFTLVKGNYKIHESSPGVWWAVGTVLAGYNSENHSGSLWETWADQWPNVKLGDEFVGDMLTFTETPDNSAPTGGYVITLRVQMLVED